VSDASVGVVVDNDIVLKAACYGLAARFWPVHAEDGGPGVLGAARFVLATAVTRSSRVRNQSAARIALREFFARAAVLEPTDTELDAAAGLERLAQRLGVELDVGESLLAAMVTARGIPWLDTGDKRAVRGFEAMVSQSPTCARLCGRVRCLEQALMVLLAEAAEDNDAIAGAICGEPDVDKAVSICFSCYSGGGADRDSAVTALESYVAVLRNAAPRILAN
jgi:hypothetical protein